ncbi:substrate-binding periplasmic protein [Pseudomonas sp. Gutcm_11s]|uniref:substrate-binding periplasmic protein n=1 Tax=Pseudomonas sp. Gutcm_11s TaxID=3026088 RepID=UPI00235E4A0B|nr:transporter substrate-binding domain-containing protein [Pseudomonas sp. Gutcm_11s]MDD0841888.1 transporter substrate-binding domain-containing protein [Pseudomonas sp. Gutcm_11s]
MFESSACACRSLSRRSSLLGLLAGLLLAVSPSVLAEPVVRIGTGDWVPYVDQQRKDGGALARLVSAVFAKAGYRVELVFYPWDRNVLMLEQGNLDAIMPYSCSPKRLDFGVCSDPLVRGEVVLFHRKELHFDWRRVEDLKPYLIGTTHGYSYGPQFDRALQDGSLRVQQNSKEDTGLRLLELGRIDLHPQDRAVGYAMLRKLFPREHNITHHPRYVNTEPLRLLFRRDDPASAKLLDRFNAELARFAERGELKRLQEALNRGDPDRWRPESF